MKKGLLMLMLLVAALGTCVADTGKSTQAQALMDFLTNINGQKTLSGTMANVNWNINEAQWVHQHTGKWPAMNCFDFIHHPFSTPNGWIDYENTSVVEQWHNEGGIVSIMWHWNVPANNKNDVSFYYGTEQNQTTFDVKKINDPTSAEYATMMADIKQIANYLKLLKDKNIPVLWRPLHEAGGMWFWWGRDADACNELWRVMYNYFQEQGLDNLVWVWTSAAAWNMPYSDGFRWYPGDEYVDIVSIDIYNNWDANNIYNTCYQMLRTQSPQNMAALTECGNVANISTQWNCGAKWLFFMPWYDYARTNNIYSSEFKSTDHQNANATWWKNAFNCDYVLTRDDVKAMMATGISNVGRDESKQKRTAIYSIGGQRTDKFRRGINIVGGKKVVKH